MKYKYIGLITVRLSSSRLPQKALLPIRKRRLIEHIIDRAKISLGHSLNNVVVCTSTEPEDIALVEIAKENGIDFFRGSLRDKIDRWRAAAEKFGADYVVTLDGDDLFCDPELIAAAVSQIQNKNLDVVTADTSDYVCGGFTHCISTKTIQKICEQKGTDDTEMTKPYLIESGLFKVGWLDVDPIFKNPNVRLTLDYPEDLEFFRRVFDEMKMDKNTVPLREILKFLNSRPDLVAINFFRQKDFTQNQKRLEKLELKNH
ncbi:MAG: NTP transferase domain-containing protein [Candidatus Yanofskybacteria bacterium]|nr:NTP transferase domain-containing protein [Candidatus Yanofskybacteria bacterium]